jgi:hypothetical protein
MPKASPIQTSFNAGKWGRRMQGRVDLAKYSSACAICENFIPTVQGPALRRPGTTFVKEARLPSAKARLIPFEFSIVQAYVLEITEGRIRFYRNSGGIVTTATTAITNVDDGNPVTVSTASHSYAAGDQVLIEGTAQDALNGRFFTVANPTATDLDLTTHIGDEDGTGRATGAGGTISKVVEIRDAAGNSIPWLTAELDAIQYVQNADVLYLVHPNHPPHKITRTSDTDWTCEEIEFAWPPFRPENIDDDVWIESSENVGTSKKLRIRAGTSTRRTTGVPVWISPLGELLTSTSNSDPCTFTFSGNHGLSNGDIVYVDGIVTATVLNDRYYTISNVTATTFDVTVGSTPPAGSKNGIMGYTIIDGPIVTDFRFTSDMVGSHFRLREIPEINMPEWKASSTFNVEWAFYDTSPNWAGRIVHYAGNVYATIDTVATFGKNPPTSERTTDPDMQLGAGAAPAGWRFYNNGSGYVVVTAVASDGLSATIDVVENLPYSVSTTNPNHANSGIDNGWRGQATVRWSEGAFSADRGYPRAVAFFEDRLWFGGTDADPQTFWGSKVGRYEDFELIDADPSAGLQFTIASADINAIESMAGDQALVLLTRRGEFVAAAGTEREAITGSNITVRRQSAYGCAEGVQPVFVDSALIFAQRATQRLHALSPTVDPGPSTAPDLTDLEPDILRPGIAQIAYQGSPFRQILARTNAGELKAFTYIPDQDVFAWTELPIGGTGVDVESVAVIPHPDGDQDQVWLAVKRTVSGATVRYIEVLNKPHYEGAALEDAVCVDSAITYDGSPTTTIPNLGHLEGETVQVLGDGIVQDEQTVTGGAITISSASVVQVGLPYQARLQTMRLEAGGASGAAQGRRGRIHQLVTRLDLTGYGLEFGQDFTDMDRVEEAQNDGTLYTGDTDSRTMPGGYTRSRQVAYRHQEPTPCTIVAAMPQLTVEER